MGFLGGVFYWATAAFSVASVATAFATSVGVLSPSLGAGLARSLVLTALFAGLAVINIRGIKPGVRLIEGITVAKLLPLLLLIGVGAWSVNPEYLKFSLPTPAQVGQVSIVLIFAYQGIEVALMPSGEVRDPARTMPRAILGALALTTLVYLAIQGIAQGILGPDLATYGGAPLAEAARRRRNAGKTLVLVGGTVSMFRVRRGRHPQHARALFALRAGRRAILAGVHPRFHTPALAIVACAGTVTALSISSSFERLAVLATVSALFMLLCVAASTTSCSVVTCGWLACRSIFRRPADSRCSPPRDHLVCGPEPARAEFLVEAAVLAGASIYYLCRRKSMPPPGAPSAVSPSSER